MELTKQQRAELRRLAEAATPGPWFHDGPPNEVQYEGGWNKYAHRKNRLPVANCLQVDADYIAAADPPTVLALLDERDARAEQCDRDEKYVRLADMTAFLLADDLRELRRRHEGKPVGSVEALVREAMAEAGEILSNSREARATVAAADPPTVLALLDALDVAEEAVSRLAERVATCEEGCSECDDPQVVCCKAAATELAYREARAAVAARQDATPSRR